MRALLLLVLAGCSAFGSSSGDQGGASSSSGAPSDAGADAPPVPVTCGAMCACAAGSHCAATCTESLCTLDCPAGAICELQCKPKQTCMINCTEKSQYCVCYGNGGSCGCDGGLCVTTH